MRAQNVAAPFPVEPPPSGKGLLSIEMLEKITSAGAGAVVTSLVGTIVYSW